jgi:capsule biosynthesis phosphatase
MRICFDLDETLCTKESLGYESCKPLPEASFLLKSLRSQGHKIIIYTARGMESFKGSVGAAMSSIGLLTLNQLKEWDFEYDEIYFGKPSADLYVDDKGQSALEFWENYWSKE